MQKKIPQFAYIRELKHILEEISRRFKAMFFFRRQAAEEKELERQAASRLLHVASAINGFSAPSPFVFPEKNKDSRTWNINHTPEVHVLLAF